MANIRGVLFDYGLVLTGPPDPAAWAHMQQLVGTPGETAFHAAYWAPRHDYDRGTLNSAAYWNAVAGALGVSLTPDSLRALEAADVELWTQPNAEMIGWAAALQRAGVRTGILSNLGDAMETGVRARLPWLADFAHHTFSHQLRLAKPEAAIYAHAIEGMALPAEEVLFVDDRADNIEAARASGLHALRYLDHAEFVEALSALVGNSLPLPSAVPQGV